jgi:hypothetical protein
VDTEIGAIARPDEIRFAEALPKTRSGKIMRRLLREIASGQKTVGDTTTLGGFFSVGGAQGGSGVDSGSASFSSAASKAS